MDSPVSAVKRVVRTGRRGLGTARRLGPVEASRRVKQRLVTAYWRRRGTMPLAIGSTNTRFHAEYPTEVWVLRFLRQHEGVILEDLVAELHTGDVFYDVGANIGVYACVAGKAGADVVAFEPYPPNVDRLEANVALNDLEEHVDVRGVALAEEDGVATFDSDAIDTPGFPLASFETSGDTVTVEKATGDSLVSSGSIPLPTVVKIDVEGAEPLVVEGLSETLRRDECRLVYCEVHREGDDELDSGGNELDSGGNELDSGGNEGPVRRMTDLLTQCGFDVAVFHERAQETHLKGRK